ncbi:MAG: DEAD/DEAH box helicase, partial [Desulfobacterales bacterium]|nr:DEAD/DEAH box helicase [Desulfobacterales bacterium]
MDFKQLGLRDELVKATESLGFQSPMPVQEKAMPVLLSGEKDFVGLAQTGTGKTGAFGLPLLQLIDTTKFNTQGIVICPTRELCLQITDDLKKFARYMNKIRIVAIYGGASISTQIRRLGSKPQIIVATPGRLIDMINRKVADLSQVSYTVLDEADEMLNMGFKEDIDNILKKMPDNRKIWLFSATMPRGVAAIARNYLTDPVEVRVGSEHQSPKNIKHICHTVQPRDKYPELKRIIDSAPDVLALVFCRTRRDTQALADSLMRDGYQSEALHGALSQAQRDSVMRKFRRGSVRILVATDVAARGLDVNDITHVIHYNLSDGVEVYTHRSGRTARVGKSGISIALVNSKEISRIRILEKRLNIRFEFNKVPAGKAVREKQLSGFVGKIAHTDGINADIKPRVKARPEPVIKPRVKARPEPVIKSRVKAGPEPVSRHELRAETKPVKRKKHFESRKIQRFFINMGRLDKINKGAIVRLICDKSGIDPDMIGEISLNRE